MEGTHRKVGVSLTDGMDSPVFSRNICVLVFIGVAIRFLNKGVRHECYYLRMLLAHGARSVLRASKVADNAGREVCGVRRWALDVQARIPNSQSIDQFLALVGESI